jgi:hypothetical protein
MASPFAIGSATIGGMVFMLLSIAPVPTKQFALLRTVAAGIGGGMFSVGYCVAKAYEKREREIVIELAKVKEEDDFKREQAFKDKLAIAESQREAFIIETKQKEAARIEVAVADYVDDVRDAYVAVQDGKNRLDRCLLNQSQNRTEQRADEVVLPEPELATIVEDINHKKESFAAKKAKLLKLLREHESGWILKTLKKPLLLYGGQGSGKSYFAEFIALCRYYLRDHQIVSIADPHFHQNKDECWQHLVKLGVPGYGAHHNYAEVNSQLLSMYDSFATRTLKSLPQTRIFDEITGYKKEEETREAAAKLGSKLSSDVRKANCSPIVIAHGATLEILGGADGFAEAINENFVKVKLNSDDEQEPLWRGTISGIKDEDGETIVNMKISIAPDWIRSSWVYNLFNSDKEEVDESLEAQLKLADKVEEEIQPNTREIFLEEGRKWMKELYDKSPEAEVEVTSNTTPWDDTPEVHQEASEARNSNACSDNLEVASILPEDVRSRALANILRLSPEAKVASDEVIALIPTNPDRAIWIGIKLLGKKVTAASRDIFETGTGGAKFKLARQWYQELEQTYD